MPTDGFDAVIDSWEVGMRKPEARLFHHVASVLGAAPSRCLLLDDMEENCAGARAVGMRTVLVGEDDEAAVTATLALIRRRPA